MILHTHKSFAYILEDSKTSGIQVNTFSLSKFRDQVIENYNEIGV